MLQAGVITPLPKAQVVGAVVDLTQGGLDLGRGLAWKCHFEQRIALGDAE